MPAGVYKRPNIFLRYWNKVKYNDANNCWEWSNSKDKDGYGRFGKSGMAHRYSYEQSFGRIPDGLFVLHKCDNPACVYPGHLFLGTQKDNCIDREQKGRSRDVRGEANGKHVKLTASKVLEILKYPNNCKQTAKIFGVDRKTISMIRNGLRWGHVTGLSPVLRKAAWQ